MIIRMLYVVLRLLLYHTLSGRPGGYPDDDFRNKKKQKKQQLCINVDMPLLNQREQINMIVS